MVLLIIMILATSVFGIAYYIYVDAKEKLPVEEVYSEVINGIEDYTYFDDIDEDLRDAFVAVEDRRFYEREGIDFIALFRAIFTNIVSGSMQEGGSTITQQLVKNVYFGYDRGFFAKLSEYFFIYDFEDVYTKDEILEMYINDINYGDGYFNVYDASMGYFEKTPDDLTVYEASLLAGIPNSPANYQLSNENPNTYKRQRHVLECMLLEGYISETEYQEALSLQPEYWYEESYISYP